MTKRAEKRMGLRRFIKQARKEVDRRIKHVLGDDVEINTDVDRYAFIAGNAKLTAWVEGFNVKVEAPVSE